MLLIGRTCSENSKDRGRNPRAVDFDSDRALQQIHGDHKTPWTFRPQSRPSRAAGRPQSERFDRSARTAKAWLVAQHQRSCSLFLRLDLQRKPRPMTFMGHQQSITSAKLPLLDSHNRCAARAF